MSWLIQKQFASISLTELSLAAAVVLKRLRCTDSRTVASALGMKGLKEMGSHGVPAIFVIPVMFFIIFVVKTGNRTAMLWTLVAVVAATLFFAISGAANGDNGGLAAIGGLIIGAGVVLLLRGFKRRGNS
jgi:hypothetical protein